MDPRTSFEINLCGKSNAIIEPAILTLDFGSRLTENPSYLLKLSPKNTLILSPESQNVFLTVGPSAQRDVRMFITIHTMP